MNRDRTGKVTMAAWVSNPVRASAICLALAAITLCCAHIRSKGAMVPDPSVKCPNFYETEPVAVADGGIFMFDDVLVQALRVATDDFFERPRPLGRPCSGKRWAYDYRVVERDDIVFVKILLNPERCGVLALTSTGATYAINADGKILHRHLGATLSDDEEIDPNGWEPALPTDEYLLHPEMPITANMEFLMPDAGSRGDAGIDPDAGMNSDAGSSPDGGTPRE